MAHHSHRFDPGRRLWLRAMGTLAACGAWPLSAKAAPGGYKALVCVLLNGGNDSLHCMVPTDSRYATYAHVRQGLALARADLLPLDGVPYALNPVLAPWQSLWAAGRMTAVANVGPLVRPFVDRADYEAAAAVTGTPELPPQLYSHADQQRAWEGADGDPRSRTGWGGRAAGLLSAPTVISLGGNAHFGSTAAAPALALPGPGGGFRIQGIQAPGNPYDAARSTAFQAMYARSPQTSELSKAFVRMQKDAMAVSDRLGPTVESRWADLGTDDPIRLAFASLMNGDRFRSDLAQHFFQVAKLIRQGSSEGHPRQFFVVQAGGYDTHADQLRRHQALLLELGLAIGAFHGAMDALGLAESVTSFTQSDFGRTFVPNATGGTDHGWGNTQFVFGAAVKGHAVHGQFPELDPRGPDDAGVHEWEHQGRWVPSLSVEQYAAPLLAWMEASSTQIQSALPQLHRFPGARPVFI